HPRPANPADTHKAERSQTPTPTRPSTRPSRRHALPRHHRTLTTNLILTKRDGEIETNPHATGGCVIVLDEKSAAEVFDAIGEWLG
ncbi:MAG: hypothetical protein ACRDRO_12235, partial [Pseudonocardiaceae bacterium]